MQSGEPSRTALAAARHRAAHQLLEQGCIFADPLAVRILGEDTDAIARQAVENPAGRTMRNFIAVKTRFAEDALAAAVEGGVGQLVVLGAGLDTYAFRGVMRERVRVFEVDHPATQAWKRRRLDEAGIALPGCLTFAPIDFECETLAGGLHDAGFDPTQQTFFTWLGVVPYLTAEAVWSTLGFIESLPNGARVAERGEPWVNYFESDKLRAKLTGLGFSMVEDLGPQEIAARYFPGSAASAPARGGHVLRAATI